MGSPAVEQFLMPGQGRTDVSTVAAAHEIIAQLPRIATRILAFGSGLANMRSPRWVGRACAFDYLGTTPQGRVTFMARPLIDVEPRIGQRDLFADVDTTLTAFSIFGLSAADIVNDNGDSDRIDELFLQRFERLTKRVVRRVKVVTLGGLQGDGPTLTLGAAASRQAAHMLRKIPAAQRVRLVGSVTALRLQGNAFELTAENGEVRCTLMNQSVSGLRERFATEIAVAGTAYFRPSGRIQRIEVDAIDALRAGDSRFARLPVPPHTAIEQARAYGRHGQDKTWLSSIRGRWPGDETESELIAALRRN